MAAFVEGAARGQAALLPECLDDWVDESNPVRFIDAFVDALDLRELGFVGLDPGGIGTPPENQAKSDSSAVAEAVVVFAQIARKHGGSTQNCNCVMAPRLCRWWLRNELHFLRTSFHLLSRPHTAMDAVTV